METKATFKLLMRLSLFSAIAILFAATSAQATTHVIQFGGSLGIVYSPNSLNVSVGDTITWEGDFNMHPLSSTSVPTGANSFSNLSGSGSFSYVVKLAGTYSYQCNIHYSLGMIGSFTALTTGIRNNPISSQPHAFSLAQNYPNPFNPTTTIRFNIPSQGFVSLKIYDITGSKVATIVNGNMQEGSYSYIWNADYLSSGVYFYQLKAGSLVETKKLVLLK